MDKDWENLKAAVEEAMKRKKLVLRKWKSGQKYWWDRECTRETRKVTRCYKSWKQEKVKKKDYSKKKAEFRSLCECKEKRMKQEEEEETRKA